MKTNELNNGMKEIYAKPSIEVEEMEVQWEYLTAGGQSGGGSSTNAVGTRGCADEYEEDIDY